MIHEQGAGPCTIQDENACVRSCGVSEITPAMADNGKVTVPFDIECQVVCELPLKAQA